METRNKIVVKKVSFFYGQNQVLNNINATFSEHTLTAIMGPSGEGKSTFLGLFNRLWDDIPGARVEGEVRIRLADRWVSPLVKDVSMPQLRRKVGMIFQEPNPLPMSIGKNMKFPLKLAGIHDKSIIAEKVQKALANAFLWEEVKDRMEKNALDLSGGQKQRLCVARALVLEPEVLLCDEPTSNVDTENQATIINILKQINDQKRITIIFNF